MISIRVKTVDYEITLDGKKPLPPRCVNIKFDTEFTTFKSVVDELNQTSHKFLGLNMNSETMRSLELSLQYVVNKAIANQKVNVLGCDKVVQGEPEYFQ